MAPTIDLARGSSVVVAMVAAMMVGLSKSGRGQHQDHGEQQNFFHAPIIPSFRRIKTR
jgi:hypothetical protein